MKRIIAILLAVILAIPTFVVFAEQTAATDVSSDVDTDYINATGLFDALGFLSEDIKSIEENQPVTRGQFAHLVACIRGIDNTVLHSGTYDFIDVQPDHIYAAEIYNLKELGVISGASKYQYLPDDNITYNEVSKILVKILGYELKAEMVYGGYPAGYVRMMANLDIINGLSVPSGNVSVKDAIKMCYNALEVNVVEVTKIENNQPTYTTIDGKTILTEYHDIYTIEGIMSDNGFTSLSGNSGLDTDRVKIADVVMDKSQQDFSDNIGKYVTAYYHKNGSIKTLKYVYPTDDNEVLVIDAKDIISSDLNGEYKITYYENDKQKTVTFDSTGDFLYNGKAYVDFTKNDFKIANGTVTLINNDKDKYYDVASVTVPNSFVMSNIDKTNEKIYGKYGEIIKYEDCDSILVYNDSGLMIQLSDLKAGNVLSAVVSKDGKVIKLYSTNNKVSGTVTKTYDEDGNTYYGIDDSFYKYTASYEAAVLTGKNPKCKTIDVGTEYTFYIDIFGDICHVEQGNTGGLKYAYLMQAAKDTEDMQTVVKFRLFMEDGSILEANAAKKVEVNGSTFDGNKILDDQTSDFYRGTSYVKPQLIQVETNSKNEITQINLYKEANSYGYNNSEFSKDKTLSDVKYRGGEVLSLGGVYQITSNAKIFCVPSYDDFEDDALQIWTTSRLTSGARYNFEVYDSDSSLTTDVFCVVNDVPGSVYDSSIMVVDEISRGLNADGEAVKVISGVSRAARVTYTEAEKGDIPDSLKIGDVIRISSASGEVTAVEIVASIDNNLSPFIAYYDGSSSMYEHDFVVHCGYLYGVSDRGVAVTVDSSNVTNYGKVASHPITKNAAVTIWDSAKKKALPGTISDVSTNDVPENDGTLTITENSVKVIAYRRQDYLREIVVIK